MGQKLHDIIADFDFNIINKAGDDAYCPDLLVLFLFDRTWIKMFGLAKVIPS